MKGYLKIGDILIEQGLITPEALAHALTLQRSSQTGKKIGDILVSEGYLTEPQLMAALAQRLRLEFRDLTQTTIDTQVVNLLDEAIARQYGLVPIEESENTLTIAMSDPMNLMAIEHVRIATKKNILSVIAAPSAIQSIMDRCYSGQKAMSAAEQLEREFGGGQELLGASGLSSDRVEQAPVVKMVNSILAQGVRLGASDIHIEANQDETRVRMRIDGELQEQIKLNIRTHEALITRLKIMADMNIAEKRIPQDGRCHVVLDGQKVDMRLSSLPGMDGEKMVIRILDTEGSRIYSKEDLGLSESQMKHFDKLLKSPHGIVLVTGPTGSGKSTTLYAMLGALNRAQENIITLEDPVEKRMRGITQVQINPKAGLTFASGLRAVLRQDPNIVMVGEIRDTETAQIATRAAITGHLVLSTLHTNDAITTVSRLVDMGVEPYLVAAGLVGVIAQRLIRVSCTQCKTTYMPTAEEREVLGLSAHQQLQKGCGCQYCNFTGYRGRRAIHELVVVDSGLRELISHKAPLHALRAYCQEQEMPGLSDQLRELVIEGVTTMEEYAKVTYCMD